MKKNHDVIDKKILYDGFYQLHELTFRHKKHDNSWSSPITREVFSGAHAATVLPYDPKEKKIILIDQVRVGLLENNYNPVIKEIVAGIIDEDESPEEAAIRECKEEIGCDINKLTKIYSYYPAPGSSQSYYHLFLGETKSFEGYRILGKREEDEDILAKCYSIEEVNEMLNNVEIINGLTLIALQWFFLNYKSKI